MTGWITELCQHVGVHAEYRGFEGQTVQVSRETRVAVLRALGFDAGSEDAARAILLQMRSDAGLRPAAYETIVQAGLGAQVPVSQAVQWSLEAERSGQVLASGDALEQISLPALPIGIHRLRMQAKSREFSTWVLARPPSAVTLANGTRIWGVLTALYGLTDGDRAPIGSYDHLGQYAEVMAEHGADFLGINPIHAMGQVRPGDVISPYSPSHREFLNTWHFAGSDDTAPDRSDLIDYPFALRGNHRALSSGYRAFCQRPVDAPDHRWFDKFCVNAGDPLLDYALFEVLADQYGPDWRNWPAPYRTRDADAMTAFAHAHPDAIGAIKWAQWQAESQLAQAQSRAKTAGMRVGLYLDLAVGPRLGGAETWVEGSSLVTGATLGAPPDPLGPQGQSWGLAPQSPLKLREQGYAGFARLLTAVMRHAGMIRIDHVLGLMRSFWIPDGGTEGTYVSYPFDALLAVVAIQSARHKTIVVGEDLGLVPEGFRAKLATSGIYGLDVLQYMRTPTGGFADPADTRELAVCAFATHDTPTIAGFFAAEDARVRAGFGGIGKKTFDQTRADRGKAQDTLGAKQPVSEIHRQLARAHSGIVAIQLDDIAERKAQQNLPGTVDEYPNWRLKAPYSVNQIETSKAFARLAAEMCAQDRSNPKRMDKEYDLQDCSNNPD